MKRASSAGATSIHSAADLGRLLRESRKRSGMTLQEAALVCGVSTRNLLEIEHGKDTAKIGRVLALLEQFGIRLWARGKELD